MKIAAAQIRSQIGPVSCNLGRHLELINLAVKQKTDLVVFPELSLTGYAPSRASELAITKNDRLLCPLQSASDANGISIVVGAPLKSEGLPQISAFIFQPNIPRRIYSKQFLHEDEVGYFDSGNVGSSIITRYPNVALAICYELSVEQHAAKAFAMGASVYCASVAKSKSGLVTAGKRLAQIAEDHSALVVMSNASGNSEAGECAGGSAVWGRNGNLIGLLDPSAEGVLVADEKTEEAVITLLE